MKDLLWTPPITGEAPKRKVPHLGNGSRPYLAATAQLPAAFRFDSASSASTGAAVLNSLVLKMIRTPSSPAPASPVSVIFSPLALSKNGVEVTFLSTLPTPLPAFLLPAPAPPRYAQKFPAETTGSSGLPRQGAVAVSASVSLR